MAYTFVHKQENGEIVSYGVKDIKEMKVYLHNGWVRDPEVFNTKKGKSNETAKTKNQENETALDAPPTRDEAIEKAQELGIEFKKNISTKSLIKKIEDTLKG